MQQIDNACSVIHNVLLAKIMPIIVSPVAYHHSKLIFISTIISVCLTVLLNFGEIQATITVMPAMLVAYLVRVQA